jgi:DNA polymerase III subunit delta
MAKANAARTALGYKELKAEMRAGQLRTLYVLYGDETFLIDKLVESLGQALITPGCESLDRVLIDGGGQPARLDLERLKAEVMTPPFLSARKLVLVRNSGLLSSGGSGRGEEQQQDNDESADRPAEPEEADTRAPGESIAGRGNQKSRQEQLAGILEKLPDSVCLVMIETKVDRRLKQLVSLIEQKGVLAEIGQEEPQVLRQWVEAECRRRGLSIAANAAESLIDRCDNSMQVIWSELSKLFLYCEFSGNRQIEMQLIAELSLPDLRGSIFDLTDALSDGRTERALQLVDTLIGQKEPVQLIQFMLARHLRQLICAAELGRPERITAALKVMPFVANRLARQARRLSIPVLEDLYARCVETDTQVKTGRIGDRLALETYLAESAERIKIAVRR